MTTNHHTPFVAKTTGVTGTKFKAAEFNQRTGELDEAITANAAAIALKADSTHSHDDNYYTETELSTPSSGAAVDWTNVANKPTVGTGDGDVVGPATNTDSFTPEWNGADSKTLKDGYSVTAAGKAILDDADAAAQRTTLGLGSIATMDVWTGTGAEYTALGTYDSNTIYLLTSAV